MKSPSDEISGGDLNSTKGARCFGGVSLLHVLDSPAVGDASGARFNSYPLEKSC